MYTTECHYCGKTYEAKRRTSKFCSGKCRVSSHRDISTNAAREIGVAQDAMAYICDMSIEDLDANLVHMRKLIRLSREMLEKVDAIARYAEV